MTAAQVWTVATPAVYAQTLTDLNSVSVLPTGAYPFSAAGETFNAYVHNDGIHSWLLVGRGRDGWEFDTDGQGQPADVGVSSVLGTPDAFVPALYSDAIVNELISNAGSDLTGVEIRIRRAGDSAGTDPYQEARWRPTTQTTWIGEFDVAGSGYEVEYEILSGIGSPLAPLITNTRDAGPNNFGRMFTWAWGGHANRQGFNYGNVVTDGANDTTSFWWENANENHAIPYTEVYIRLENTSPVSLPDTDSDGIFDIIENSLVGNLDELSSGDDDGDGLSSPDEINLYGSNPLVEDTDADGLSDGDEVGVSYLSGPVDPLQAESNGGFGAFDAGTAGAGDGLGSISGTYDSRSNLLDYTLTWNGLTSDVTSMHFHNGAPGTSGGVELGIAGPWASPQSATGVTVGDPEEANLLAGNWYLNIHTSNFGSGEIRGQVLLQSTNPASSDSDGDGLLDNEEVVTHGTNPTLSDTDGDGSSDSEELTLGSDPLNAADFFPAGTIVFTGEVFEIKGPDDLHLDPASAVIAIDLFGDMDREVNGVTFRTDGQTAGGGSASEGIVTAVTTAANQINDWAPAPIYTNGDATSAANLAEMMRDIRWMNVPNPVTVDVSGLYPGGLYEVQLLTNEGRDANRRWDIAVEDQLVVDDYSSEGSTAAPAQVWAADNSFVYRGDFTVSEDGELNVLMQRQIGGRAWPGGDGNPILQAMIVHLDRTDDDADGLPNWYEERNGRDPNVADALDLDGDGSPNAEEFDNGTDPDNADTDGDGLNDGDEIASGTNPALADSDSDGLSDGDEVNVYSTNPLLVDSDSDGVNDGVEVAEGSDPNDAGSRPDAIEDLDAISVLPTGNYKFLAGGVVFEGYVHRYRGVSWLLIGRGRNGWEFDADGQGSLAEVGNAAVLGTTGAFAPAMYSEATIQSLLTNSGADMTGAEIRIRRATDVAGTDPYQEARWRPVSQTNWRSNFDLDTNYAIEHEVISGPGSPLGPVATNTRDTNPQSGNDYTRIFTWGWGNHGGQKGFSYGQPISGVANNDPDTFLWEFADENHAIPYSELYIRLESPTAPSLPDSDGDGLADLVEMALAGNLDDLTAGDDDDDGLTSADEYYLHGTDPLVADTDGDGLNDGGEIAAGTSAFNADTDGDGLTDAQEVNGPPVTNPLNPDTDGDTWFDLFEIEKGSDPNDINSVPAPDPLHLLGYWEFNDVDDAANAVDSANGYVGQVLGGAAYTPDAGGRTGAPGDYGMDFGVSSANQYVLVPDGSIVNEAFLFDEVTIAFWQKLAQPANTTAFKAASPSSSGAQRGISAHAPWGNNIIYFDTAGCCEIPGQRLQNAVPDGTDFTQWHHFAFVKNGDVKEIWLNGELVVSQPGAAPLPFDITELTLGSSTGGAESIQGIMDDYALFSRALTPEQIALLAEGTSAIDLVTPPKVVITDISVNPDNGQATMTWSSREGKTYSIFTSTDLVGNPATDWTELTDGFASGGDTTTFTDTFSGGGPVRFYVVIEN